MAEEIERRRGPDLWVRSLRWLAVIGWVLMLAALWVAGEAKPQMETFFERWSGIRMNRGWDMGLARTIFYLMIPGLVLGYGGLLINVCRSRRHKDEIRISLVLLTVMATIGTILCMVYL